MGRTAAEDILQKFFDEELGRDWEDVKPSDDLRLDLDLDSLDMANLEIYLEDSVGLTVPWGCLDKCRTVYDLTLAVSGVVERPEDREKILHA
jgi:acyl carrier protein